MKTLKSFLLLIILATTLLTAVSCAQPEPRGTVWHYGADAPDDTTVAEIGDFYLDTDKNEIYVQEAHGWEKLTSLNGDDGKDGKNGQDGTSWLYDSTAPTDADGVDGNFWLDTATSNLYTKSEGKWKLIATLK